ncbi:MAG: PilW family protein [Thermoanaerobaculia bacterium]|nr:PilW family protein [Thermoanaerobaculia bacterium]
MDRHSTGRATFAPRCTGDRPRESGFTLIEMVITLFVTALLLAGLLTLFNTMNKISRVQTHVADLQQNLRVAQYEMVRMTRMAARGGLLRGTLPDGFAVDVRNEVPDTGDEAYIAEGNVNSPKIEPGTDVLTVRGVFTSPVYQMNAAGPYFSRTLDADGNVTGGTMQVQDPNPDTGVPQSLVPIQEAIDDQIDAPILLVSPLESLYAVVELDHGNSEINATDADGNATDITIAFEASGGTYTDDYNSLVPLGQFPPQMQAVSAVGLLEELRFYVAEPDGTNIFEPRLTMAEFMAGTETPWNADPANLRSYIADNILDLQVALGIDLENDGDVEDPGGATDEWLFDQEGDTNADGTLASADWNTPLPGGGFPSIYFVRISTLARTDRGDVNYVDDPIEEIEDRTYAEPATPGTAEEREARRHRRRLLETTIDLRNLS